MGATVELAGSRVRLAMTFTETQVTEAERFITDPSWVMQQKLDGTRALAVIRRSQEGVVSVTFLQRGGKVLKHAAAAQHLDKIERELRMLAEHVGMASGEELVLDGEILTGPGTYHVFDVPQWVRADGTEAVGQRTAYPSRLGTAQVALAGLRSLLGHVRLVRTAWTEDEKREMWRQVQERGLEGAMVKRTDSLYEPGRRTKDGLKLKLVKEADVVVTSVTRERNDAGREVGSICYGAYDGTGALVPVGCCSVIGKPEVHEGDVITVAFLYWTGSTTYQPRMREVRTDKLQEECTMDQFLPYSRDVI